MGMGCRIWPWSTLAVANAHSGAVSVLLGNGDRTFQPAVNFAIGVGIGAPFSVAVGDFNGDGIQDLAVANETRRSVSVLLGRGNGTFQAEAIFGARSVPYAVAVGDFNGDGMPDLAVVNEGDFTVSVLI